MLGELLALSAALMWATSSVLYRHGMERLSPKVVNTVRALSATLFLFLVLIFLGRAGEVFSLSPKIYFYALIASVFGLSVGDIFYLYAIKTIGISRAIPIASSTPWIVAVLSVLFLGEKITPSIIAGILLIFCGIYLIREKDEVRESKSWGFVFALGAAGSWSIYILISKLALAEVNPVVFNTARMSFFAIAYIIVMIPSSQKKDIILVKRKEWWYVLIGAILDLVGGAVAFYFSLTLIEASRATPLSSLSPVFATLFAYLFAHEKITPRLATGIAVCLLGIFVLM
jgi:DME family drug/metabolite transporter